MNLQTLALAGALVLSVSPVLATQFSRPGAASAVDADPSVQLVHHKPNHHGGPPWARRHQEPQDWRFGHDQNYWRYARQQDEWRYDRAPERITVCRTVYRTEFDSFEGDYVRRPVQVCRERYGY